MKVIFKQAVATQRAEFWTVWSLGINDDGGFEEPEVSDIEDNIGFVGNTNKDCFLSLAPVGAKKSLTMLVRNEDQVMIGWM